MKYDPQYKYCPQCNDEYVFEIIRCAACGIDLLSGEEMQKKEETEKLQIGERLGALSGDEEDLLVIQRGRLQELRIFQEKLENVNIGTLLIGDENSCGKGCCPSTYNLLVRMQDGADAMDLIKEEFRRSTNLDDHDTSFADEVFNPENGNAICPACGFSFSTDNSECPDCGLNLDL